MAQLSQDELNGLFRYTAQYIDTLDCGPKTLIHILETQALDKPVLNELIDTIHEILMDTRSASKRLHFNYSTYDFFRRAEEMYINNDRMIPREEWTALIREYGYDEGLIEWAYYNYHPRKANP